MEQELRKERVRRGSQPSDTLLGKTPPTKDMRQQVEDIRKVMLYLKFSDLWNDVFIYLFTYLFACLSV